MQAGVVARACDLLCNASLLASHADLGSRARSSHVWGRLARGFMGGQKISSCTYALYYLVLFFSYWFGGSKRFDVDGDGGFDVDDVQAFLAEQGIVSAAPKANSPGARAASPGPSHAAETRKIGRSVEGFPEPTAVLLRMR